MKNYIKLGIIIVIIFAPLLIASTRLDWFLLTTLLSGLIFIVSSFMNTNFTRVIICVFMIFGILFVYTIVFSTLIFGEPQKNNVYNPIGSVANNFLGIDIRQNNVASHDNFASTQITQLQIVQEHWNPVVSNSFTKNILSNEYIFLTAEFIFLVGVFRFFSILRCQGFFPKNQSIHHIK